MNGTRSTTATTVETQQRWRRVRRGAALVYRVLLVAVLLAIGVPTDRGSLLLIVLAGLGITCIGRSWRAYGQALLDWLPFTAVLIAYDYSRGVADALGMPLHVSDVAAVDRLAFGQVPTVWLQNRYFDPGSPHWYDAAALYPDDEDRRYQAPSLGRHTVRSVRPSPSKSA